MESATGEFVRYADMVAFDKLGEVVVTCNEKRECVLVSRQDKDHKIISIIWKKEIELNNQLDLQDMENNMRGFEQEQADMDAEFYGNNG